MATIDLEKTSKAYDYLAESEAGRASLASFESAIDGLRSAIEPDLNQGEFVTVLRGLTQGMTLEESDDEVSGFARFGDADMQKYIAGDFQASMAPQRVQFMPRVIGRFNVLGVA